MKKEAKLVIKKYRDSVGLTLLFGNAKEYQKKEMFISKEILEGSIEDKVEVNINDFINKIIWQKQK